MEELQSIEQWHDLWEGSFSKTVFLFKHSTSCPISAEAFQVFQEFIEAQQKPDLQFALVKVIEQRPVSNAIAEELQIKHESPQLFIIKNKHVIWHDSHWRITKEQLEEQLAAL